MKRIEINGEEYPVRMTFRILTHFGKKYKMQKLSQLQSVLDIDVEDMPDLMLRCVKAGCKYEEEECNLTKEQILDALDEDFSLIERFMTAMSSSMVRNGQPAPEDAPVKESGN